nr:PREDICTED: RNA-binding protein 12B isoform X1 [Lepisosteus oculatus]XP_015213599.1 PREDICTED: RNA-binding protein 12B isoform X1 [Lepisosteus oculatus]
MNSSYPQVLLFVLSMAVVIRLQGLRIDAGSEDIRSFFTGLKIPDGGVHIIGGELEEAFIIFVSDEDARRAMIRSGGCIKGSPVHLQLSSKTEMQNVLEASTRTKEASKSRIYNERLGLRRTDSRAGSSAFTESFSEVQSKDPLHLGSPSDPIVSVKRKIRYPRKILPCNSDGYYLHLHGMPFSVTEKDVRMFFQGLEVEGILLFQNKHGQKNGRGIVKFATLRDASEGLKRDREYIGSRFVEVNCCTEKEWINAGGREGPNVGDAVVYDRESSPASVERYSRGRTRSRSPVMYRSRSSSPSNEEYCVLVENLSYTVEKRDIQRFFHPVVLSDDQILHLYDRNGKKTRAAFVLFKSLKDYCAGLGRHKDVMVHRMTYVSPISKEKMVKMLETLEEKLEEPRESSSRSLEKPQSTQRSRHPSERTCIYVRNLPFDVRKVEVMDFFQGFAISEDCIHLLHDEKGNGLGEALVRFQSEEEASKAEYLNGQRFLGCKVMLKCISRAQVLEFGVFDFGGTRSGRRPNSPLGCTGLNERSRKSNLDFLDFNVRENDMKAPFDEKLNISMGSNRALDPAVNNINSGFEREDRPRHDGFGNPGTYDGPTCVKLVNLPLKITINEIYDFCYGYQVIPGSVSLQYNRRGLPKGSATVVFESWREAQTAVQELNGRPIGTRKIQLTFV